MFIRLSYKIEATRQKADTRVMGECLEEHAQVLAVSACEEHAQVLAVSACEELAQVLAVSACEEHAQILAVINQTDDMYFCTITTLNTVATGREYLKFLIS